MATFSPALRHVKDHLEESVPQDLILRICAQLSYRWRERLLGPDLTVWLYLLQLLANVALRGLRHTAGIPASAQAICAAKMRLPVKLFTRLLEHSAPEGAPEFYRGIKVYIADGLGFRTCDNPQLAGKFGKPANQRGTSSGYPAAKMLALLEAGGGYIRRAVVLPWKRHEFTCLSRLFKAMIPGSLLMGDRGLVSFTHLFLLMKDQLHGLFRLPLGQVVRDHGKGSRRLIKRQGKQDLLVEWFACRRPKWLSGKRWEPIKDQTLILRQISFRICRKGYRTHWAWIITTLLDPQQYPAQELVELYGRRWQIEVDFRDLKRTLNLHMIGAKTVAGVQKEVLAYVLLYNLIRTVMNQAAKKQGVPADRISFIDAMLWLLHSSPGTPLPRLQINPVRRRKTQPRRVKNARHRFPGLNGPRAQSCMPPCVAKL